MYGTFEVYTAVKGMNPYLWIQTELYPNATDVTVINNVFQHYVQFANWDTGANSTYQSFNNVVMAYSVGGTTSIGWTTNEFQNQINSCGLTQLQTITKGGYLAVKGENTTGTNPWASFTCNHAPVNGALLSNCNVYRDFLYTNAF